MRRSWTFTEEKTVGINTSPPICCLYNWWQWILHIETECSGHSRYSLTLSFCNCCWDLRSSNNIVWFELKISYFSHILTKPVSHLVLKLFVSDTNTILRNIISLLIYIFSGWFFSHHDSHFPWECCYAVLLFHIFEDSSTPSKQWLSSIEKITPIVLTNTVIDRILHICLLIRPFQQEDTVSFYLCDLVHYTIRNISDITQPNFLDLIHSHQTSKYDFVFWLKRQDCRKQMYWLIFFNDYRFVQIYVVI